VKFKIFCYILFFFILSSGFISAQNLKEVKFINTVKTVADLIVKKDTIAIKKYIHKNTGLFFIYRPGVMDCYTNYPAPVFNEQLYPNMVYSKDIKVDKIQYGKLPEYNCDKENWSKTGCYADTSRSDHLLSTTAKNLVTFMEIEIDKETISRMYQLELNSRRVVIVSPQGSSLIFYLSYISSKWYLTIIDQVTGDCSA